MTSIRFKWNVFQRNWLPIEWFHFRYFNFEDINDNLKDKAFKGGQFNSCIIEMVEIRLNFVLIINNLKMIITWTTLFRNWRHFGVITSDTEIKMVYITKHSRVKWLEKSFRFYRFALYNFTEIAKTFTSICERQGPTSNLTSFWIGINCRTLL